MVSRLALSLSSFTLLATGIHAAKLPLSVRGLNGGSGSGIKITSVSNPNATATAGFEALLNQNEIFYFVQAELGGATFNLQLDSGSSDLWAIGNFTNQTISVANTTDLLASITYGDNSGVQGPIALATLSLGGYDTTQAFINPNRTAEPELLNLGGRDGIIGVGFDRGSAVYQTVVGAYGNDSTLGLTPLSNIFATNPDVENCLDVFLQRTNDLEATQNGTFLIGEHAEGFENVTSQPKLYTIIDARWTVAVTGIKVNGQAVTLPNSSLPVLNGTSQLGALLDTGTTLGQVPPAVVNAIYTSIPGAVLSNASNPNSAYIFPCDGAPNVTFSFGGVDVPVHPLDLSFVSSGPLAVNGSTVNVTMCSAAFQGADVICPTGACDFILGDSFLRNTYQSYVFGNETDGQRLNNGSYAQIVPTTNAEQAWVDFKVSRAKMLKTSPPDLFSIPGLRDLIANGTDVLTAAELNPTPTPLTSVAPTTYTAPATASTPTSGPSSNNNSNSGSNNNDGNNGGSSGNSTAGTNDALQNSGSGVQVGLSAVSDTDDSSQLLALVDKYGPVVVGLLAGNVAIGVLLLLVAIFYFVRKPSTVKTRSINPSYAPVRSKDAEMAEERFRDNENETYSS